MMTLETVLNEWDGKATEPLINLYNRHHLEDTFVTDLLALSTESVTQDGATWLIKHHLENGGGMNSAETTHLYTHLPTLTAWPAKLHILQSLPYLSIDASHTGALHTFLHNCLTDTNKMVRAWTYNGFYELAQKHPAFGDEVQNLLSIGITDEAASVRARIRKLHRGKSAK